MTQKQNRNHPCYYNLATLNSFDRLYRPIRIANGDPKAVGLHFVSGSATEVIQLNNPMSFPTSATDLDGKFTMLKVKSIANIRNLGLGLDWLKTSFHLVYYNHESSSTFVKQLGFII